MSIQSRLSGQNFSQMPPFVSALNAGVNDELEPIRRELARLNAELQVVRGLVGAAQQSANSALSTARSAASAVSAARAAAANPTASE
jgi:hypothetical protein